MDKPEMIYTLIPAVMGDIAAIGKDKYNDQQKFRFRGIDDVMNAMKPILTKHQVFVAPEVLEQTRETKTTKSGSEMRYSLLKIRFTFFAPDGSHVDVTTLGEGMDSGDKASNKAMSIAFKYALFQLFCIPTAEMTDPDGETPQETVGGAGAAVRVSEANRAPRTAEGSAGAAKQGRNGIPGVTEPNRPVTRKSMIEDLMTFYDVKKREDFDLVAGQLQEEGKINANFAQLDADGMRKTLKIIGKRLEELGYKGAA